MYSFEIWRWNFEFETLLITSWPSVLVAEFIDFNLCDHPLCILSNSFFSLKIPMNSEYSLVMQTREEVIKMKHRSGWEPDPSALLSGDRVAVQKFCLRAVLKGYVQRLGNGVSHPGLGKRCRVSLLPLPSYNSSCKRLLSPPTWGWLCQENTQPVIFLQVKTWQERTDIS